MSGQQTKIAVVGVDPIPLTWLQVEIRVPLCRKFIEKTAHAKPPSRKEKGSWRGVRWTLAALHLWCIRQSLNGKRGRSSVSFCRVACLPDKIVKCTSCLPSSSASAWRRLQFGHLSVLQTDAGQVDVLS